MIKNYFRIAWRNLWKNRTFTLLNLGGLTISFAACLIIFFWAKEELNYDTASPNVARIFRVGLTLEAANQPNKQFAVTSPLLAPVLLKDFPEIEKAVRLGQGSVLLGYKEEHFFTNKFLYADPDFFSMFGYPLLAGNAVTALSDTKDVVISESTAMKLFGTVENAIGKTITGNDTTLFAVTAVAKDIPTGNHFHFDIVSSIKRLSANDLDGWWNDSYYTYILLKEGHSASSLESKMSTIMDKYYGEENKKIGLRGLHFLQPMGSIHLHSNLRGEIETGGNIKSLRIFIGIAIFLLLVSCINYINLTTATSFKRAKEIGMRKVAGASLPQLVAQFLSESVLIAGIALLLSIGLAQLSLPFFNSLAGTKISLFHHLSASVWLIMAASIIVLGMIAGIYPALYLSGVKVVKALEKSKGAHSGSLSLRKVLVVFQFSLSILLIVATIVAVRQLRFMQSRDLGLDKEQVVAIPLRNMAESEAKEHIKDVFRENNNISAVTSSSSTPGKRLSNIVVLPEGVAKDHIQTMNTLIVDYDFINTYKLTLAAGRGFSKEYGGDSSAFVLNETAVKELGWGDAKNAIGKGFEWGLGKKGTIIGVVKDFHFNSLQKKVFPIVMHFQPANSGWYSFISVRMNTGDLKQTLGSLKVSWNKLFPAHPFDYYFVDEDYDKQYKTEQRLSSLSLVFSGLIIFISCLGLLGLVMVAVTQRTKEIGVRKVLGASVPGIIVLLSADFLKLVTIALLIALPTGWWLMNKWLDDFAYRTNIAWWIFLVAGMSAIMIALITISFRTVRAALSNPVKSLKTE